MNPNALILMTLRGNHDISFIQHEHLYFAQIKNLEFETPIQNFPRCPDYYVVRKTAFRH